MSITPEQRNRRIALLKDLSERVQRIISLPPDEAHGDCDEWEIKYELVFDVAREVRELGYDIEYYDPDATYEEDVRAYATALEQFAVKRVRYMEVL